MRRVAAAFVILGLLMAGALAETWYVRGSFNGWGLANPMTWDGSKYVANVALPGPPGEYFEFKVANADWSLNYPPDNHKSKYPALSAMNFYFYEGSIADGWNPAANRVGYDIGGAHWELMGSWNGWSAPAPMTYLGDGVYRGELMVPAGAYEFKFRTIGDWECSVGQHFGRFAPNATFVSDGINPVPLWLDLPGGRWLPEPGSLAMVLLGLLLRRR